MDAAKSAGTKKVYWSGLMPVHELSGGKYTKVEHFDTKVSPIFPAWGSGIQDRGIRQLVS